MRFVSAVLLFACVTFAVTACASAQMESPAAAAMPAEADSAPPALKPGEERAQPTGSTKLTLAPEEIEQFILLEREGGTWIDLPETVLHNLERARITPEMLSAYARGDNLVLIDYLRHKNGRWYALMAPFQVTPPTKPGYAAMIVLGFHGFGLVFDEDQARARWRRRQHKLGLPAAQASDVADQLIRLREEAGQTAEKQ